MLPPNCPSLIVRVEREQSIADHNARIEREQRMPDAGIGKPSRGEILAARRVATYREGNVGFALPVRRSI